MLNLADQTLSHVFNAVETVLPMIPGCKTIFASRTMFYCKFLQHALAALVGYWTILPVTQFFV